MKTRTPGCRPARQPAFGLHLPALTGNLSPFAVTSSSPGRFPKAWGDTVLHAHGASQLRKAVPISLGAALSQSDLERTGGPFPHSREVILRPTPVGRRTSPMNGEVERQGALPSRARCRSSEGFTPEIVGPPSRIELRASNNEGSQSATLRPDQASRYSKRFTPGVLLPPIDIGVRAFRPLVYSRPQNDIVTL